MNTAIAAIVTFAFTKKGEDVCIRFAVDGEYLFDLDALAKLSSISEADWCGNDGFFWRLIHVQSSVDARDFDIEKAPLHIVTETVGL